MPTSLPDVWHIEHLKLVAYLLNIDHPYGCAKARVFLAYGFSADEPERLATALFDHVDSVPCRVLEATHDTRYVFEGPMRAPHGLMPRMRSVWLADAGDGSARLLTAYPRDPS